MKKLLLGTISLALASMVSIPAMAGVKISVGIALPPAIVFQAPPDVIVLPDTNDVYAVPNINVDLFFWNGWWWRLWEGRWYRSHYYDRGWAHYNNVPSFYFDVDPGWRRYYRDRDWHGHRWEYERIPNGRLQQNWRSWHKSRHWERQRTWGVRNYKPRPQKQRQELRRQRQEQYQKRPEVQRHQQQIREQQRQSRQRQPRRQEQMQKQRSKTREKQRPVGSQQKKSQKKPEREDSGYR